MRPLIRGLWFSHVDGQNEMIFFLVVFFERLGNVVAEGGKESEVRNALKSLDGIKGAMCR